MKRALHAGCIRQGSRDGLLDFGCVIRLGGEGEGGGAKFYIRSRYPPRGLSSRGDYRASWNCARARRIRGIITTGNVRSFY